MKIGLTELIVIFLVALVVVGPDKLPYYAKRLGEALGQFRKYSEEATKDIKKGIVEPLEEAQRPLKEALQPLEDLDKSIRGSVKDVQKSFSDIGKEKKEPPKKEETAAEAEVVSEPATPEAVQDLASVSQETVPTAEAREEAAADKEENV